MLQWDFQFAADLANTMDWNMSSEDFQLNKSLEPDGCLVAFDDAERVGIATCISFGEVGWFGNLVVKEKYRQRGIGSLLVKHAVAYLQAKGVETIGIYAYPHLTDFYSGLGFKLDEEFSVFHTQCLVASASENLPTVKAKHVEQIEQFDSLCFGANRKKVLELLLLEKGNLSYYLSDDLGIAGYVAATVYSSMASIGPLVCREDRADYATMLLKAALGKLAGRNVYAVMPKKQEPLTNMLFSAGFKEAFCQVRMFLGIKKGKNCIYMAESLERG